MAHNPFKNKLAEFVYLRTYARWIEAKGRRENWEETVDRVGDFLHENVKPVNIGVWTEEEKSMFNWRMILLQSQIFKMEIMPSMRLMQFAGDVVKGNNICMYNCSYIAPTTLKDFADILYILMCGVGVGFSVEESNIEKLPRIKFQKGGDVKTHTVEDSRSGWADALLFGLTTWYNGGDVNFNYTLVRLAGTRLKTTGGTASGPEPLRQLLNFTRTLILNKQGSRLRTINVHDIICKTGECVVAGGVRRSALISLSDLHDDKLRAAKTGQFYNTHPYRSMSNNSVAYNKKPSDSEFMVEWLNLMKSGTGERGIFNRSPDCLEATMPDRRQKILSFKDKMRLGTNPCGEIVLQSHQFCNLTEVIVRANDNSKTLLRKMLTATILGTLQSYFTEFPYISDKWATNCRKERLLGVSLSGIYDNKLLSENGDISDVTLKNNLLRKLKKGARRINRIYAKALGINPSTCITCIKPSGTVSQVVDCASGIHPRFSDYYIRRVRVNTNDPIFHLIKDQGIPFNPEVGQTLDNMTTAVVDFVVKSPDGAVTKDEVSAKAHYRQWLHYKVNFTEHNPSVTIQVDKDEWFDIGWMVYNKFNLAGGLSFLPKYDHVYQLAPYEAITKEEYESRAEVMNKLDFSQLPKYESTDTTETRREVACGGGSCEI